MESLIKIVDIKETHEEEFFIPGPQARFTGRPRVVNVEYDEETQTAYLTWKEYYVLQWKPRTIYCAWTWEKGEAYIRPYKERYIMSSTALEILKKAKTVAGRTYDFAELLKAMGFRWNPEEKVWERR